MAAGLLSVGWSLSVVRYFEMENWLAFTAEAVRRGHYDSGYAKDVEKRLRSNSGWIRPSLSTYRVLIQLGLWERSNANNGPPTADSISDLRHTIRNSLADSPNNSFSWLALFWLSNLQGGPLPARNLTYMRMSYSVGRNEGWIAEKRNALTLSYFRDLPPDLLEAAGSEFNGMIASGFYGKAADIFVSSADEVRAFLAGSLLKIAEPQRKIFLQELSNRGLANFGLKEKNTADHRPWH